jgi:hypothetical protein
LATRDPIDRLREALERAEEARSQLARARVDELEALRDLRARGMPWRSIAGRIVPPRERHELARVLRQRYSERLRVGKADNIPRSIDQKNAVSSGRVSLVEPSWPGKEANMLVQKVVRRVTVTEDFAAREDALEGDDDSDDEPEEEELDEGDVETKAKGKGKKR